MGVSVSDSEGASVVRVVWSQGACFPIPPVVSSCCIDCGVSILLFGFNQLDLFPFQYLLFKGLKQIISSYLIGFPIC